MIWENRYTAFVKKNWAIPLIFRTIQFAPTSSKTNILPQMTPVFKSMFLCLWSVGRFQLWEMYTECFEATFVERKWWKAEKQIFFLCKQKLQENCLFAFIVTLKTFSDSYDDTWL